MSTSERIKALGKVYKESRVNIRTTNSVMVEPIHMCNMKVKTEKQ
jgi:hypothetical protein